MENGRIDLYDSDKMDLGMPEDPLSKITNGKIEKMWRPWSEKENIKEGVQELDNDDKNRKKKKKEQNK
jgi:hypothetical protein